MLPNNRHKRRILRDRRRGYYDLYDDEGVPLFGPMTGWDLWLHHAYSVAYLGALLTDPRTPQVLREHRERITAVIEAARNREVPQSLTASPDLAD